ncbi:MAG: 3'-5' exonuclease [Thermoanaerobaculia bacterium]
MLERFGELIRDLVEAVASCCLALLERLLERPGYAAQYDREDPEGQARLENIQELLTAAQEFTEASEWETAEELLTAFLDHVSLVADIDEWSGEKGVSLMTPTRPRASSSRLSRRVRARRRLLPHFNASGTEDDVEEERRLLYVGMTRAKRRLLLSSCRRRRIAGRYQDQMESPFLLELPAEELEVSESPELFAGPRMSGVYTFYERKQPSFDVPDYEPVDGEARGQRGSPPPPSVRSGPRRRG